MTRNILHVDDDGLMRLLVSEMLVARNFAVDSVALAEEGLRRASSRRYDLVILDYRLPGMNGIAAAKSLRQCSSTQPRVPVLLLTGEVGLERSTEYIEADIAGCLVKPFTMTDLLEKVADLTAGPKALNEPDASEPAYDPAGGGFAAVA